MYSQASSRSVSSPVRSTRLARDYAEQTHELFLHDIVQSTRCSRHGADYAQYCFTHEALNPDRIVGAVCNRRALKAGFNGTINPRSLMARPGLSVVPRG